MARKKGPLDAVQFTRESAERIAGVVRQAELTPPAASPLTFAKRFAEQVPKQVRAATFSGSWPIGGSKVVTFKYAPTATVNAVNLSWPVTLTAYSNEDCIVGRDGTNWWLIVPKLEARTAVFATRTASQSAVTDVSTSTATITYLSDVSVSASLNTNSCEITVSVTKTTNTRNIVQSVNVATGSFVILTNTATTTYLRIRVP
jgi:hypothetical protein